MLQKSRVNSIRIKNAVLLLDLSIARCVVLVERRYLSIYSAVVKKLYFQYISQPLSSLFQAFGSSILEKLNLWFSQPGNQFADKKISTFH